MLQPRNKTPHCGPACQQGSTQVRIPHLFLTLSQIITVIYNYVRSAPPPPHPVFLLKMSLIFAVSISLSGAFYVSLRSQKASLAAE